MSPEGLLRTPIKKECQFLKTEARSSPPAAGLPGDAGVRTLRQV